MLRALSVLVRPRLGGVMPGTRLEAGLMTELLRSPVQTEARWLSKEKTSKEDDERLADWLLRDNDVFDVPFPPSPSSSSSSQQRPQQRNQGYQSRPYNSQQQTTTTTTTTRPSGGQERAPTQYQQRPPFNQSRPGNFQNQQQQQSRPQGSQDRNQERHQFNRPRDSGQFQQKTQGKPNQNVVKKETKRGNEVDAYAEPDDIPLEFEEEEERDDFEMSEREERRAADRRFTERRSQGSQSARFNNLEDFIRHLEFPIGPSDRINLVDQFSRIRKEPITISQAFQLTRGTDLTLKNVSPVGKDGLPTFRLYELQALMKLEQNLRDSEADDNSGQNWSLKERGDSETKEIRIKLGIWENDLNTKMRKLEEILGKGKRVQIVILPRKYEPEKPEMSELLTSMVHKLEAVGTPSTPQIFVGNRLTCTVIPNVEKEKVEKPQDKYKDKKIKKRDGKSTKLPYGFRFNIDL